MYKGRFMSDLNYTKKIEHKYTVETSVIYVKKKGFRATCLRK